MNCDEYRKAIGADPGFDGGAGHVAGCPACRDYRVAILDLDGKIARALAIDVPPLAMPQLPELDTTGITPMRRRGVTPPAWFALAAMLVLAVFVGIRLVDTGYGTAPLADQILAHLPHESFAVRVTDAAVPAARLASVVPGDLAGFDGTAPLISYAQTCEINGKQVPPLVMQGASGPVVILLMPEEKVPDPVSFGDDTVDGVILPVGGGSIAIVGQREERLDDIKKNVMNSVTWTT